MLNILMEVAMNKVKPKLFIFANEHEKPSVKMDEIINRIFDKIISKIIRNLGLIICDHINISLNLIVVNFMFFTNQIRGYKFIEN